MHETGSFDENGGSYEQIKIAASRKDGKVSLDDMYIGYKMSEHWESRVGQFKIPFLREYLVSSGKQLAVERSYVNHVFGLGRSQGVQACHRAGQFCAAAMIHDGADNKNQDFLADRVQVGLAGRGEWLLAGSWKQFDDFNAWSRNKPGILFGGAIDWEHGQHGSGTDQPDVLEYTVDLSTMYRGWSLFAGFVGQHVDGNGSASLPDLDQFGVVVQAGTFVVPDKLEVYGRYEHLALDGYLYEKRDGKFTRAVDDSINLLTVGANYYVIDHRVKLSCDAVWALDPLTGADTGAGLVASPEDDQVAVRVQLQLYF